MKKILSVFLAMTMLFSLAACGTTEDQENSSAEPSDSGSAVSGQEASNSESANSESSEMETAAPESELTEAGAEEQGSNILVAYFSWAYNAILADDVDAVASPSVVPPGNVQQLAGWVQEETDGDLFSIRVTEPYSSDWDECLERANQERSDNARPALVENVENLEQYDTILLGYPKMEQGYICV